MDDITSVMAKQTISGENPGKNCREFLDALLELTEALHVVNVDELLRRQKEQLFIRLDTGEDQAEMIDQVKEFCVQLLELVARRNKTKSSQHVERIREYIHTNYSDSSLSLYMAAEQVGLSPSYLSRLFKQEMGASFVDYISSVRVEKAKELLADAGYADGFDLEITVPSSYSQHVDSAQIIADELSQVGINVTLNQVEWSTWLQDVYKGGNFQATVIGFDGTLAPSDWLKKYVTDDAKNFMHYSNTEYDDVFNTAYTTVDDDVKVENYKKAQMILAEDAAAVYIEDPANLVAVSKKFGGYTFYPTAAEDMSLLYQVEQ